ncbi:MAG TPA: hypothetical protein PKG60_12345 [Spirochaetota bacterium]|nr:hypothetical protein [Spirochaetota bacterium]
MKKQYLVILIFFLTIPAALQSREFLNTVVHLNFGGMYTFSTKGDILDSENEEIKSKIADSSNVSHYETAYCATLDIVPTSPFILGMEEHAIKFGVRGSYRLHYLQQRVTAGTEIGDQVMDYRSWMIGPVVHYAPFIEPSDLNEDYTASGGFTFYALYGRINGNLTAFPSVRESGAAVGDYSTKVTGYKIDVGVGAEIALCSLNVGVNVYYSYINLNMKDEIYSDLGKNGYLKEGCLEIYVGIPIESFIEPLIPKF